MGFLVPCNGFLDTQIGEKSLQRGEWAAKQRPISMAQATSMPDRRGTAHPRLTVFADPDGALDSKMGKKLPKYYKPPRESVVDYDQVVLAFSNFFLEMDPLNQECFSRSWYRIKQVLVIIF
jgi:hypothetical protein